MGSSCNQENPNEQKEKYFHTESARTVAQKGSENHILGDIQNSTGQDWGLDERPPEVSSAQTYSVILCSGQGV